MIKHLLPAAALALGFMAAPAFAQTNDRALIIYGDDRCPENGTVCIRAPESERYRIPGSLRSGPLAPQDQPWSQRAASIANVGAAGTGSCTSTGAGGWTGCWKQQMKTARAEKTQDAAAIAESPLPK